MAKIRPFIIISFILLFSACFSNERKSEQVIISYWTTSNQDIKQLELELIMEFQKKYPYISVIRRDYNTSDYAKILYNAFNSNNAPDIFTLNTTFSMPLITDGHLEPLNISLLKYENVYELIEKYIPGSLLGATYWNQIFGLPVETSNLCLVIINDSFKGNIKTFEELLEYSKINSMVKNIDKNIIVYFNINDDQPVLWFSAMLSQLGGKLVIPELRRASINNKAGRYLFKYLSEFRDRGLESPFIFFNDSTAFFCSMQQIFQAIKANPDNINKISVFKFPRFKTRIFDNGSDLYLKYFYVNSHSNLVKRKAGWMLADWLTSHPFKYLKNAGVIQPNKRLFKDYFKDPIPFCDIFIEDIENCRFPQFLPEFKKINRTVIDFISYFFNSEITPSKAAEMLQAEIDNILK